MHSASNVMFCRPAWLCLHFASCVATLQNNKFWGVLTLKFKLCQDLCAMHLPPKFHHPVFTRSEVIVLTNKQTNRRCWKHPMFFTMLRHWVKIISSMVFDVRPRLLLETQLIWDPACIGTHAVRLLACIRDPAYVWDPASIRENTIYVSVVRFIELLDVDVVC